MQHESSSVGDEGPHESSDDTTSDSGDASDSASTGTAMDEAVDSDTEVSDEADSATPGDDQNIKVFDRVPVYFGGDMDRKSRC